MSLLTVQDPKQCLLISAQFLTAPDVEIRIISKAFVVALAKRFDEFTGYAKDCVISYSETEHLLEMIATDLLEPYSIRGLSFETLFWIIKDLAAVNTNLEQFMLYNMPSALAELSEKLPAENRTLALEVMCTLLEGPQNQALPAGIVLCTHYMVASY